jgi:hypothetical protein
MVADPQHEDLDDDGVIGRVATGHSTCRRANSTWLIHQGTQRWGRRHIGSMS